MYWQMLSNTVNIWARQERVMHIEKHKHVAILESIHTFPWISQKPFWQHFVCVCVRMSVSQGFPPPGVKDWPQTQSACHCKGPAALSISANRHCLGFPPVCIFRMIIVQNIQYVCAIMETRMALVISPQEMALRWPVMTSWGRWWPRVGLCQLCGFGWELDTGHDVQVLHRSTSSKGDHTMQNTLVMKNWWFCFHINVIFNISAHICSDQTQCVATNSCAMTFWYCFGAYVFFIPYLFQKKG